MAVLVIKSERKIIIDRNARKLEDEIKIELGKWL
jgi:hypothetical protein